MNEWYERAAEKLAAEKKTARYDKFAQVMKNRICEKLTLFCKQDQEFAQAVVQGGTFEDCMRAVAKAAKAYGEPGIPDEDAMRQAVQFYFPGADVKFHMTVNLCANVENEEPEQTEQIPEYGIKVLDLEDFL